MTQEEKELLLKDLCTRLPYGLKVYFKPSLETGEEGVETTLELIDVGYNVFNTYSVYPESVIPYLRPMSSMTEEEFQELHSICPHSTFNKTNVPGWIIGIDGSEYGRISRIDEISKLLDWLNSHHFDYRGLIEKGLALEVTEGMYNI
jgi:hypothetical protein